MRHIGYHRFATSTYIYKVKRLKPMSMKTLFTNKTHTTMKTLKLLLLSMVLLLGSAVNAQIPNCGVDTKFGYKFNSANFAEFKDSSRIDQGWQVLNYLWKFGDGQTSTAQNPSHFYPTPGTFNACLMITGKTLFNGTYITCMDSFCKTVTVTPCNTLYIGFQQIVQGSVVTFTSFVSNNAAAPLVYSWNFGDGSGSHDPNPVHTYAQSGVYNVCLAIEDANGCRAEKCQQVAVTTPNSVPCGLEAHFGRYPVVNGFLTFQFIDSSHQAPGWLINNYQWKFGDGTSSNLQNPQHTYTSAGIYNVCLIIGGENPSIPGARCSDTICKNVVVGCNNIAGSFTWSVSGSTATFQSSFSSNYPPLTYQWKFGDGSSSVDANPSHTYSNGGVYNVCVNVKDASGCLKEVCKQVTIGTTACGNIHATFSITSTATGTVTLQNTTPGVPSGILYQWWMDGQALNNPNPNTAFTINNVAPGSHEFCLYLYVYANSNTPIFCDSSCRREYIGYSPSPCNGAQANFTFSQNGGNLEVNAGTNYPTGTAFQWKLNGQSTNISAANNHYLYTGLAAGTYRLCLFIYSPTLNGSFAFCDSLCKNVTIGTTNPCTGLSAAWTYAYQPNNSVKFTPVATPVGVIHGWSFGDGTTSGDASPIHAYTAAGYYRVCHYVYIPGTNCKDSSCAMIQVNAPTPCIGFGVAIQDVPDNNGGTGHTLKANVTGVINSTGITFKWSTNATTQSIRVDSSGHYCVTATYNNCSASACIGITINPNPCANLNASWTQVYNSNGCVSFKPGLTSTAVKHAWTFGDGHSSTNVDPVHCYATSGLFTVCHIVYIPGTNCADTVCRAIQANGTTTCRSGFTYISAGSGNTVYFTDASQSNDSIVLYQWNFGDGTTSNDKNPVHQYPTNGKYYVCHTIKTTNNCTNTKCDSVKVGTNTNNCRASFLWEATNCLNVRFKNTSSGGYNHVQWFFGDGTTDTVMNPLHTYTSSSVYRVLLVISGPYCQDTFKTEVRLPSCHSNDTICGVLFEDSNSNGVMDSTERGLMGVTVYVDNVQLTTDSSGGYFVVLPQGPHNIKSTAPTGCMSTMPILTNAGGSVNYYGYRVNGTGGTYCGYNFGVNCQIVRICGTVFFDPNNNGTKDSAEAGIGNVRVVLKNSNGREWFTFTNNNGEYCVTLPADNYTIKIVNPYPNSVVTPGTINLAATTAGQSYTGNDFAIYRQPGVCDLKLDLVAHTCVSPGFPTYYSVQVRNNGTEPTGGQVHLFYDPAVTFGYAAPVPASHNATTRTITWNIPLLNPGQFVNLWATFRAVVPLQIGQFVFTLADVNPNCTDINFANNIDTVEQLVRSSWDPNNKLVNPLGKGPQGLIQNGETLTYTINFQNTGNAPAVNVVLRDMFTDELEINTMEMLASSHPYTFQMEGNEGVWKFSGIMLPDSGTNEPASHGFVMFSMKPKAALAEGTEIFNHADIYFDYNAAVVTEPTLNTIDYKTSVEELAANNVNITLMPNPFREFTTIKIEGAEAPYEIKVYDLLGKLVSRHMAQQNIFTIQRGSMTTGVYLYEVVKQNQFIGKGKMIAAE